MASLRHAGCSVILGLALCTGMAKAQVISMEGEPFHTARQQTPKYRVFHVKVPVGQATQFHQHAADNFAVLLSTSDIANERADGVKASASVKPGGVAFAAASSSTPYVHRIHVISGDDFENVTIELLAPAPAAPRPPSDTPPGLVKVRDTPRGTAFRLDFQGAPSIRLPTAGHDAALVCLQPTVLLLQAEGQQPERWPCEKAQTRLFAAGQAITLTEASTGGVVAIVFD